MVSFVNYFQKVAYAIYNDTRKAIDGRAGTLYCSTAMVAEARAILEATMVAAQIQSPCWIVSDCQTSIDAINSIPDRWPWECYGILGRIEEIRRSSPLGSFLFQPRATVQEADKIAKSARNGSLLPGWISLT
ncbi:hypothetical protein LINGRAHAP2_LOCUS22214 [Linum grandiflorum]